ncbi:MAG: DUF5808 domain-containing protein [Eubacteriales bacterium]
MILSIIYIFTALIILFALISTNRTGEKPNGNILLGVTLPHWEMKNNEVIKILHDYHKANTLMGIILFVLIFPILFISQYVSISMIYLLVWCILIFYVSNIIQRTFIYRLYSLKKENGWYVGTKYVINIDTEVSRLKGKMPASKFWFIFPFIIALIPGVLSWVDSESSILSWIFSICSFISLVIGFFAYMIISKQRTITYSQKTEINFALNCIYKYQWSRCWIAEAYIGSILYCLMFFFTRYDVLYPSLMIFLIAVSTFLTIIPILSAYYKVRNKRNELLIFDSNEVYADDDQYWVTGNYYNPNDKRLWVEKRFGYGTTINMASNLGKFTNVFLVVIVIGIIALSWYLMPLDFGSIDLEVKDNTAFINAPMYKDSFSLDDVNEIELIKTLPKMSKRNGGDSDNFYVGSFSVQGYGNCTVYVHRNNGSFIVVTLSNRIVIFNGSTPEKTEDYLQLIK